MSDVQTDWRDRAEAAMRMAAATSGFERLQWVRLAQVWQDLGRDHLGAIVGARRGQAEPRLPKRQD